jgi:hypothetical protein
MRRSCFLSSRRQAFAVTPTTTTFSAALRDRRCADFLAVLAA